MEREDEGSARKVIRVGILTRIPGLDPRRSLDRLSTLAVSQIYETPYSLPKGAGYAEPLLFDGPLRREDEEGNVLSAGLLAGVRFSDGTALRARHVVASLGAVEEISAEASVEARGERIFFFLKQPNPRFDLALTLVHCSIVLEREDRLLGTGPFVPAPEATPEALRLVSNPYYRMPMALDEVEFCIYPPGQDGRPEALLAALRAEEVDFTNVLSRSDVAGVHGFRKAFQPSNSTAILFFNTERRALSDRRLRLALALGIDKRRLTEISYSNVEAFMATSLLPPMMGVGQERLSFDLTAAKSALQEAGGPPARPLRMLRVWAPRPYMPYPQPVAELLVEQLGRLGVRVEIETPRDAKEYFDRQCTGDYDLLLGGWIADNADPSEYFEATLLSSRIPAPAVKGVALCNLSRLRCAELDRALEAYRCHSDPEHRRQIQEILAREVPLVPLMYGPSIVVHAWHVSNVEVSPIGVPHFALMDLEE